MYYHCREMKYTLYDKVAPAPAETIDEDFLKLYQWLGKHCGYCPQIWLSRSTNSITGYKRKSAEEDWVMFGFDIIKGFPIHYDRWELFMSELMHKQNLKKYIDELICDFKLDLPNCTYPEYKYLLDYAVIGEKAFLQKYLFVEHDQVVVPSLNLKSAKVVFCKNEKQKKKLRQMGFIEDRIKIKNIKYPYSF